VEEGIGLKARHRDTECLKVPRVFELETVVSCRGADPWWSTKLDFGSGEPLDDLHWSSTLGTAIKIGNVFGGGSKFFGKRFLILRGNVDSRKWAFNLSPHGYSIDDFPQIDHGRAVGSVYN
jgi:hypothetical protein